MLFIDLKCLTHTIHTHTHRVSISALVLRKRREGREVRVYTYYSWHVNTEEAKGHLEAADT